MRLLPQSFVRNGLGFALGSARMARNQPDLSSVGVAVVAFALFRNLPLSDAFAVSPASGRLGFPVMCAPTISKNLAVPSCYRSSIHALHNTRKDRTILRAIDAPQVQEAEGVQGADPDPGNPQRKRDRVVKLAGTMAQKGRDFWTGRPGGIRQSIRKTLGNLVGGEERRNQTNGALGDLGEAEEDTSSQGLRHDEDLMEPKNEICLKTTDPSTGRRRAAKRKHLALTRSLPRPAVPLRPGEPAGTAKHNSTEQQLDAATQKADGPKVPNAVVQRTCVVPAPLEVCVAVASDLDRYSQWCHSGLKRLDVLERVESSGQASLVRMDVGKYGREPVIS